MTSLHPEVPPEGENTLTPLQQACHDYIEGRATYDSYKKALRADVERKAAERSRHAQTLKDFTLLLMGTRRK